MRLRDYLADHVPQLACWLVTLLLAELLAVAAGLTTDACVVLAALLALGGASALVLGYLRDWRFLRDLGDNAATLEHAWQLPLVIEEPDSRMGRSVLEALAAQGRSAADDVNESVRQLSAYRSYIEAWIHEVKVPIAAAGLVASRLDVDGRSALLRELDRINAQVEQALWYARSESAELDYTIRETPLACIVRDACKDNARLLIESGASVEVAIDEGQRVFTDAKWAAFVISQAVVNAAKYGAVHVRASASVEDGGSTDERTVLELADDGWGIPAADVPHVFERGFTGENGHAQARSTGMGLYLAARICEKLGLGLEIASEEGSGTRVLVSFPHDRRRLTLQGRAH